MQARRQVLMQSQAAQTLRRRRWPNGRVLMQKRHVEVKMHRHVAHFNMHQHHIISESRTNESNKQTNNIINYNHPYKQTCFSFFVAISDQAERRGGVGCGRGQVASIQEASGR
jgi:hypothetical protein